MEEKNALQKRDFVYDMYLHLRYIFTSRKKYSIALKGIENFTNVFTREVNLYLDEYNAQWMIKLFSNIPLPEGVRIQWTGSPIALLTFFYLVGILDLVESKSLRTHSRYSDESKDADTNQKDLPFCALIEQYFYFPEGACSKSTLWRIWNGNKDVMANGGIEGAICDLQEKVKDRFNSEKDKARLTKKKALIYYFENKDRKNIRIRDSIDKKMLDIVGEIYLKHIQIKEIPWEKYQS